MCARQLCSYSTPFFCILLYLTPRECNLKILDKDMNILRAYRNWRRYRRTVNALSHLSTYELYDLGIYRGDIDSIAWHYSHKSL